MKNEEATNQKKRAIIIGGSLGGLFAGNLLRKIGWDVAIYERAKSDLDSRGGGIVLQPDVVEVFRRAGVKLGSQSLGVRSTYRTTYRNDGSVIDQSPAPQIQTSWSLLYTTMRDAFGADFYHLNKNLVSLENGTERVVATFQDGTTAEGDLLIGADGNGSTVRDLLWPNDQPTYAGYFAWRGLVPEKQVPSEAQELLGNFDFANTRESQILGYLVPGHDNNTKEGSRFYNWVWYRTASPELLHEIMTDKDGRNRGFSIPEGKLQDRWMSHLEAEADEFLPPNFGAMVKATESPFAQAIRDLRMESMVKGRVALIGDAAFIPRPHTAASTSKAAFNAINLADALQENPLDLNSALRAWEPEQLNYGNFLYSRGTSLGDRLMFENR